MVKQERSTSFSSSSYSSSSSDIKYKGVRKRKWGKYVSEIRLPNSRERIWLGSYDTPEKAAKAFDAALFCLRGNNAKFNFPDQPPEIPGGTSLHPSQIQAAASRFANEYYSSLSLSSSSSSSSSSEEEEEESLTTSPQQDDECSYMNINFDHTNINSNTNNLEGVPDFEIFPGFDDYFIPLPLSPLPPPDDSHYYGFQYNNCDIDDVDPSFLWSF